MSPALNGSSAIQRFEGSDAIEIHDGIMFDFYTGLPQYFFLSTWGVMCFFCDAVSTCKICRSKVHAKHYSITIILSKLYTGADGIGPVILHVIRDHIAIAPWFCNP